VNRWKAREAGTKAGERAFAERRRRNNWMAAGLRPVPNEPAEATIGSKARPKIESAQYEQKKTLDIPFRSEKTNQHLRPISRWTGAARRFLGCF
jgi:hypothetical protein